MLYIKPEKAYLSVFADMANRYLSQITDSITEKLSEKARNGIAIALWTEITYISDSTGDGMCVDIIAKDNLLVALDPHLCTKEQMTNAVSQLRKELESGEKKFSDVIWRVADERLSLVSAALIEMFRNLSEHKTAICNTLFDGKQYTAFTDIKAGAGDYHNHGHAAAIIETDAGKMVYKPRNTAVDVRTYEFVEKYFLGSVIIPKSYTDMKSFGVCEFLEKSVAIGDEAARKWFYCLGELTAMAKLLGCYDLHHENVIAVNGRPAMIDIETVINPLLGEYNGKKSVPISKDKSFSGAISSSVWCSLLLPYLKDDKQLSVLADTESENNSAPIVDGKPVKYNDYSEEYHNGLNTAYRRCTKRRAELEKDIPEMFGSVPIRVMVRNTQFYNDLLIRTYKRRVLASEEARAELAEKLERVLEQGYSDRFGKMYDNEKEALLCGDIPYFYTFGDNCDLYCEGEFVISGNDMSNHMLAQSGVSNAMSALASMNETELAFENAIIKRTFECLTTKSEKTEKLIPSRSKSPLPRETAINEAESLLKKIYSQLLTAPNGTHGWIDTEMSSNSPQVLPTELFNGTLGIGIFAAAVSAVTENADIKAYADECARTASYDLAHGIDRLAETLHNITDNENLPMPLVGESNGFAGFLRAGVLMNSCCGGLDGTIDEMFKLMKLYDLNKITNTDRIGGIAGLLAALCDIPELTAHEGARDIISALADRLLDLKTFNADGYTLWETVSKRHIISGAGHGMAGIAEALYSAAKVLGNDKYLPAAKEALDFERSAYNAKFGTWNDYRTYPPQNYMHGYCSGAPGIGIMLGKTDDPKYDDLVSLAADAVDRKPMTFRDHLCCGNSAVVEYYLTADRHDDAGRVLGGMYERKKKLGVYRIMPSVYEEKESPVMFFGISGVGYEMMRYAFPDKIRSIFL